MQNKKISKTVSALLTWTIIVTLLVSGCGGRKEQKTYKVGILMGLNFTAPVAEGFKAGMTELGYVAGENITYDMQIMEYDQAAYQKAIQKFIDDDVDLIFTSPTEPSIEAKKMTQGTDIPVVFSFCGTEDTGLIESVRQPGGNITGVRFPGSDITVKRFEIMRAIVPDAKRIWVPYQANLAITIDQLAAIKPVAEAAGITLIEFPANNAAELQAELDKRAAAEDIGIDAILMMAEPLMVTPDAFAVTVKFAYEHDLPFGGAYNTTEEYSTLYGVNVDLYESGKLAAPLADKILKGAAAGTIPVVTPDNFIQINYKLAQELGLTVPEGILKQADEIIR